MARSIIFTIVLLISLTSYSQCDSRKIETDSCGTMVLLTTDDFTEFYVAKRTLKQISKEFPELKNNLKKAEKALKTTLLSSFANQGQICLCGSRIFVEKPIL